MSPTWDKGAHPDMPRLRSFDYLRVVLRGAALLVLVMAGLFCLLCARLVERPVFGQHRPVTPFITQAVCRTAFRILGIGFSVHGTPMQTRGAVVANHSSWLDIFALNAAKRVYFVSKSEVAAWPVIGWLARATGTMFIERNRARARQHTDLFEQRLLWGHKLLFFPEGTSTDGLQILPFKTTLFQAFFAPNLREEIYVQPACVVYHAPVGTDPRFYGWWGDMALAPHLVATLAPARQGRIDVVYCPPLRVAEFDSRKSLAAACETAVRSAQRNLLAHNV